MLQDSSAYEHEGGERAAAAWSLSTGGAQEGMHIFRFFCLVGDSYSLHVHPSSMHTAKETTRAQSSSLVIVSGNCFAREKWPHQCKAKQSFCT